MPYLGSTPAEKALEADDIASNAVTTAKIADDAVDRDKVNLVSTSGAPSLEAKGDGSSQDGYIQLNCSQNSHGIKLKSPPHSASQSYTLTYPSAIVDGGFMKTDSSGNLSFAGAGVVQIVHGSDASVSTTTTQLPNDNTKPQNDEGGEVVTVAITPTNSSNKLFITSNIQMTKDAGTQAGYIALFQDTTADALAAAWGTSDTANNGNSHTLTHVMTAGTTSSTTFKMRGGNTNSGTVTFNGESGSAKLNGTLFSTITIMEIAV